MATTTINAGARVQVASGAGTVQAVSAPAGASGRLAFFDGPNPGSQLLGIIDLTPAFLKAVDVTPGSPLFPMRYSSGLYAEIQGSAVGGVTVTTD